MPTTAIKGGEGWYLPMFTQLNPTIPLHVLEKGDGYAIGMIDYGQEHNLIWVTVLNDSGEIWCAPNPSVRLGRNWTMGRKQNPLIDRDRAETRAEPVVADLCGDCAEGFART